MSCQVIWSKIILETFIAQANLTKEEEMIMRTRVAGWTRVKQSMELGMSLSSIDKHIARLKVKYDAAAKYSAILPPRKHSAKETYMDTYGRAEYEKKHRCDCQDEQEDCCLYDDEYDDEYDGVDWE